MKYYVKENGSVGFTTENIPEETTLLSEVEYTDHLNKARGKVEIKVNSALEKRIKDRSKSKEN